MTLERRVEVFELRAEGRRLQGYAAVFHRPTRILDFTETVAPGTFKRSLESGFDILALVDHERGKVLARTKAGTLRLSEDAKGLRFETDDLPNTSYANDALELVRTGNIGGASFAFRVPRGGDRWEGSRRTLTNVDLREISIVSSWPAYSGTSVSARSRYAASADTAAFLETVRRAVKSLGG